MPKGSWTLDSPSPAPSARLYHGMTQYDTSKILLFGGQLSGGGADSETWERSSGTWAQQSPATTPTARYGHGLSGALAAAEALMFGGRETGTPGVLNETHTYDGADWTAESPSVTPPARYFTGLCPSPSAAGTKWTMWGGLIATAGTDVLLDADDQVWEWTTGGDWAATTVIGRPSSRYGHAMWYDSDEDVVYIFGGRDYTTGENLSDLWAWDGSVFTRILPGVLVGASARAPIGGAAYDSVQKSAIIVPGGQYAEAAITVPGPLNFVDGETVVIPDAAGNSETFEFDPAGDGATDVQVDISTASGAADVATALAAAINASGAINVIARIDADVDDATVLLLAEDAAREPATSITDTVADTGFVVTDWSMPGDNDSWSFGGSSRQWLQQDQTDPALGRIEGAGAAFDGTNIVVFGGAVNGSPVASQYLWTWTPADVSPYAIVPGSLSGRIQPTKAQAQDGSWVFCLGADMENLPEFVLDIGDVISIEQDFEITAETMLLRFRWRMRYHPKQPKYRRVVDGASVDFKNGILVARNPATGEDELRGVEAGSAVFRPTDRQQVCTITGATNDGNNGSDVRVALVASGQGVVGYIDPALGTGSVDGGSVAVLNRGGLVTATEAGTTIDMLGARWRARCEIIDGSTTHLRTELLEDVVQASPDGWQRANLAAHVSKMSGAYTTRFSLKLEQVTS